MRLATLTIGLDLILNDVPYRLIRRFENGDCQLENQVDSSIIRRSYLDLLSLHFNCQLILVGKAVNKEVKANSIEADLASYPESEQKVALRRYQYIKQAENDGWPGISDLNRSIQIASARLEDKSPPSPETLYRWINKWKNAGYSILVLLNKKTGPKNTRFKGLILEIATETLDEVYFKRTGGSIKDAYDSFRYRLILLNKSRDSELRIPQRSTFYRHVSRLDKYEIMVARKGKLAANKFFRATGKGVLTLRILERTEIDHTPLDFLVFDNESGLPIGRPTLTCIIDCHSRAILGFRLDFEGTSELGVMLTLRNAILPKTYVKDDYPDINGCWNSFGIMNTLVCDNGLEFHAHQLRRICSELNIELVFCPKKEPRFKGKIERFFRTLNRQVSHQIEGTTFSNINQRGDYQSEKLTIISLKEITEVIHMWIIEVYSRAQHKGLGGRTPESEWKKGLKQVEPILPESKMQLDLIISREYKNRTLSHEGVLFKGLFYNSNELAVLRQLGVEKVSFRVDPEELAFVRVFDEYNIVYITVPCTYPEYADGLTLLQHLKIRQIERLKSKEVFDEELYLEGKERLRRKIQQLEKGRTQTDRKRGARLNKNEILSKKEKTLKKSAASLRASPKTESKLFEILEFETFQIPRE